MSQSDSPPPVQVRGALASWITDIIAERSAQEAQWGVQRHPHWKWYYILMEEVGEVAKALNEEVPTSSIRAELVQVAAVAVTWIQHLDEDANG